MRWVRPQVFLIAKSVIQDKAVKLWLECTGCDEETATKYSSSFVMEKDGKGTHGVISPKTSAERIIELAGRRCYLSFQKGLNPNVTKIREEIKDYIDNILKSGHGSVLEHASFTFAIENVSRVFTGEMNRHRAGFAISEGSMRYIRYSDIPICEVPSIRLSEEEQKVWEDMKATLNEDYDPDIDQEMFHLKIRTRTCIKAAVEQAEQWYGSKAGLSLQEIWKETLEGKEFKGKKHITSMMRRIIPMGVATGGIWTGNVRALRHMLTMRCSEAAEEEIQEVAVMILELMIEQEPTLFRDFNKDNDGYYKPEYFKV